jgi:photosystem II stability/assembly factor-like uncharacterized protein
MKRYLAAISTLILICILASACNLPAAGSTDQSIPPNEANQAPTTTIPAQATFTLRPTLTATATHTLTPTPLSVTWNHIGLPTGAQGAYRLLVHPENDAHWLVLGHPGELNAGAAIYLTRDAGQTWQTVYTGALIQPLEADPQNPDIIYSSDWGKLIRSSDGGQTWSVLQDFEDQVQSVLISPIDGYIYVGPRWYLNPDPGIYRSSDGGQTWTLFQFETDVPNFLPWDIEEDPNTGILYTVIEIADHPQPYDPPFYRSMDRGETWEEVGKGLTWHGFVIQVDPQTSDVYFLSEGEGLFKSIDEGRIFHRINRYVIFSRDLSLDPANSQRIIGSDQLHPPLHDGGVYYSDDAAKYFLFLGLEGYNTVDITLNAGSTRLYVVTYEQGIYTAEIPTP